MDTNIVEEKIKFKDILLGFIDIFRNKSDEYQECLNAQIQRIRECEDNETIQNLEKRVQLYSSSNSTKTRKHFTVRQDKNFPQREENRVNEKTMEDYEKE